MLGVLVAVFVGILCSGALVAVERRSRERFAEARRDITVALTEFSRRANGIDGRCDDLHRQLDELALKPARKPAAKKAPAKKAAPKKATPAKKAPRQRSVS